MVNRISGSSINPLNNNISSRYTLNPISVPNPRLGDSHDKRTNSLDKFALKFFGGWNTDDAISTIATFENVDTPDIFYSQIKKARFVVKGNMTFNMTFMRKKWIFVFEKMWGLIFWYGGIIK